LPKYEVTYILDPVLADEQVGTLVEKFSGQVTEMGAEVVNVENWGRKRLAYEINGKREGTYVLMRVNADAQVSRELDRFLKQSEDVLKCMVIKAN